MNMDYLEAFMYVVKFKSFHKAAEALYLTQPSITARIKGLERELETQLFIRQGRGITLTEKGKDFIPFAEQMIRTYQQSKDKLRNGPKKKKFTFGANMITAQYVMPELIRFFSQQLPTLEYDIVCGGNEFILERVSRKEIDVAFVRQLDNPSEEILSHSFLDNSIHLVVHPSHPFATTEMPSVYQIAKEPLVFFECGAFNWNLVHKLFEAHNVKARIRHKVGHMEIAKSFILHQSGIGFLPKLAVKKELEAGALRSIDVSHLMNFNQQIERIHSSSRDLPREIEKSIDEAAYQFEYASSHVRVN